MRVLDLEADLGRDLDRFEFEEARERLLARRLSVGSATWSAPWSPDAWTDTLGCLIISGGLMRRVRLGDRLTCELLGPGDVVQPWHAPEESSVAFETGWRAWEDTELAVLDRRFQQVAARWPEITAALVDRVLQRNLSLSVRLALVQVPRLSERLHLVLWHLADRWGKVDPDGVVITLQLSHQTLAELTSAQRPSVSHAIRHLTEDGHLDKTPDGRWRLLGDPPPAPAIASAAALSSG